MTALTVPCHSCGYDNPATVFHCGNPNCQATIRLHPVIATQSFPATTDHDSEAVRLVREAYLVAALLSQSAYRLLSLLKAVSEKGKG